MSRLLEAVKIFWAAETASGWVPCLNCDLPLATTVYLDGDDVVLSEGEVCWGDIAVATPRSVISVVPCAFANSDGFRVVNSWPLEPGREPVTSPLLTSLRSAVAWAYANTGF